LLPCRIDEHDVFQTVVWTMSRPGSPQVTLVAECHVGSLEYFRGLSKILGDSTPEVWVGFEARREVENESGMTPAIRKRVGLLRQERALRSRLAEQVGLVARHDALGTIKGTNMDATVDEVATSLRFLDTLALRVRVKDIQRQVDRSQAGNKAALKKCRRGVVRMLRGVATSLKMPQRVERMIRQDAKRSECVFDFLIRQLREGREVRLLMDAFHILAIRRMLEAEGYVLSADEVWLDCADLTLLA
jgi:hypothetical protein